MHVKEHYVLGERHLDIHSHEKDIKIGTKRNRCCDPFDRPPAMGRLRAEVRLPQWGICMPLVPRRNGCGCRSGSAGPAARGHRHATRLLTIRLVGGGWRRIAAIISTRLTTRRTRWSLYWLRPSGASSTRPWMNSGGSRAGQQGPGPGARARSTALGTGSIARAHNA
eukprot:scaffold17747_cov101-Isochrysis_galbana.AAC.1